MNSQRRLFTGGMSNGSPRNELRITAVFAGKAHAGARLRTRLRGVGAIPLHCRPPGDLGGGVGGPLQAASPLVVVASRRGRGAFVSDPEFPTARAGPGYRVPCFS